MITLRLWRALLNPPLQHPLYQQATKLRPAATRQRLGIWIEVFYLVSCCGLAFLWPLALQWLPLLLLITVIIGNTLYSMAWAINISQAIARERETYTYDLLCLAPPGPFTINWALCTARIHRTQVFVWVYFVVRLISTILMITLAIALVIPLLTLSGQSPQQTDVELLHTVVFALVLTIVFFTDHIYSFVLGSLVGIATPNDYPNSSEARFRAMATFLMLQLISYAIPAGISLLGLPVIYLLLQIIGWFAPVGLLVLGVASFLIVREIIIRHYWRSLLYDLNVEANDLANTASLQPL